MSEDEVNKELDRRARQLLEQKGALSLDASRALVLGIDEFYISIRYGDGPDRDEFLTVWTIRAGIVYRTRNGVPTSRWDSTELSTRVFVLDAFRREMVLDDIASVANTLSTSPDGLADV